MNNSPLSYSKVQIKLIILTTRYCDLVTETTTEAASVKKALSEAEHKAALERKERKKQEARVGEVQEEL